MSRGKATVTPAGDAARRCIVSDRMGDSSQPKFSPLSWPLSSRPVSTARCRRGPNPLPIQSVAISWAHRMVEHDPYSTLPPTAADPSQTSVPTGRPAMLGLVSSGEGRGPSPDDSVSGRRIVGNYVIERELGRGGMGVVYLATHAQLRDRRYAVKLFSAVATSDAVEQFRREVEAIGKSRHANLLYAIDAGSHEGNPYLVTEFLEGRDIAKIIRGSGALPTAPACEIGRQMALALDFAHTNGIIHRDIKPQNAIVQPNGQVKILDLGLASVRDASGKNVDGGNVVGTPPYMPPEQWRPGTAPEAAADIYAFGCTLFEMLAGRLPFPLADHPDVAAQRHAHLTLPPPKLGEVAPHVPGDVARVVDRCLEKDPARRPRTCGDIAAVLEPHATPIVAADLFGSDAPTVADGVAGPVDFDAFIDEPRPVDTSGARLLFVAVCLASFTLAMTGLTMAYFGPSATDAWRLRFDRLGDPRIPAGVGFAIEAARSMLFLALITTVAYFRFRLPLKRFLSPGFHTSRVWIARGVFGAAMLAFLGAEFDRQWYPEHAATDMVAWASAHEIDTTPQREVVPYRWYWNYSLVHYTFVFGGLLLLPILQFVLADLPYVRRAMTLFAAAQRAEPNPMEAVDRLYAIARVFRTLAARYVDTAGVLAVGVQFEYWIGRWTLSEKGFLIEVVGMLVTAGIMVLVIAYVASQYTAAIDLTASGRGRLLDHRMEQRLEQFNLAWFLRSSVFSRPGGIAVASLLVLAVVAGRRSLG